MLSLRTQSIAVCVMLMFSGCFSKRGIQANWYAVHGNGSNSDYSSVKAPRNVTLAWQRKFNGNINLGPTNDLFGKVYITTNAEGCHLYALDRVTGETIWCSSEVNKFAVASSALVDENGNVFIADNAHMFAFNNFGNIIWKTSIIGFPFSAQFIPKGRLIFITHIGIVYVMDKATGKNVLAPYELSPGNSMQGHVFDPAACMRGTEECPCANTLAVDQKSERFYFTYWEPGAQRADLIAMQYSEMPSPRVSKIWRNASLPGGSASSPDISFDGKKVYVNDNSGGLHAIDAKTGKTIWQYDIGYATGGSQSTSPNGTILPAGGTKAPLICIQDMGNTPRLLWRMDSVINRGVPTQTAGGLIFATLANKKKGRLYNRLVVIEAKSGKQIDEEELPGTTLFTVGTTIGPWGDVYVPAFNGRLFAFRKDD
jgi:outer membrane protein assembly factor BamB